MPTKNPRQKSINSKQGRTALYFFKTRTMILLAILLMLVMKKPYKRQVKLVRLLTNKLKIIIKKNSILMMKQFKTDGHVILVLWVLMRSLNRVHAVYFCMAWDHWVSKQLKILFLVEFKDSVFMIRLWLQNMIQPGNSLLDRPILAKIEQLVLYANSKNLIIMLRSIKLLTRKLFL